MSVGSMRASTHAPTEIEKADGRGYWLLTSLIALVGVGKAIQADTMDPDAFWHLRVADQLLRDGIGPLVDSISFMSVKSPWTPYSWLAELTMRAIWLAGGFRLAVCVTAACSLAIALLIAAAVRQHRRVRNDLGHAVLVAAAAFFVLPFVSFRPVTFALVILATIVWLLVCDRRRPTAWVWAIVPLTALLTNLHLYSVIAVAVVVASAAGAWFDNRPRFRAMSLLAAATTAAACATPMLPGAITTALRYNASDPMVAARFIVEMRPFYDGGTGKASLALFVAAIGLCVWRWRALPVTDWLWLLLGSVLLFRLGRFSPVFAMLAAPSVGRVMPVVSGATLDRPIVRAVLAGVIVVRLLTISTAFKERDFDRWLNRNLPSYPTAAAAYVDTNVPVRTGRLINEFNWGGYLAWRFGGRFQVFMDGRTQLYAPDFWQKTYLGNDVTRRSAIAGVTADAAVLPARDCGLVPPLVELGWREAYRDEMAVVLVPR